MKAIAPRNEIASDFVFLPVTPETNCGRGRIEIPYYGVLDLEHEWTARRSSSSNQIFDNFVLPIDGDGAACKLGHIDSVTLAVKADIDAVMAKPHPVQPFTDANLSEQIYGVLLQNARPNTFDHIFLAAVLDNDRVDALKVKQMAEK